MINQERINSKQSNIHFNLDLLDDDMDFKPISKGLGLDNKRKVPVQKRNKELALKRNPISKKLLIQNATNEQRAYAFVIDLLMIVGITLFSLFLISSTGIIVNDSFFNLSSSSYFPVFFIIFFSINYILYFGLGDISNTAGKDIMNIKLIAYDSNLTLSKTIARSTITLLSFLALGFPLLLRFQDRLSETKIVNG